MMEEGRDREAVASRGELVPVGQQPGSIGEWAEQLVARAREDGVALTGEGGLLTDLTHRMSTVAAESGGCYKRRFRAALPTRKSSSTKEAKNRQDNEDDDDDPEKRHR